MNNNDVTDPINIECRVYHALMTHVISWEITYFEKIVVCLPTYFICKRDTLIVRLCTLKIPSNYTKSVPYVHF